MIKLYSAQRCPYALRTRLALKEKGLEYEHIEIDLRNKPADFIRISRYGKVPALFDGDSHIYESSIINEYLDERYPKPRLMPSDPMGRARARIWIDYANSRLMPTAGRVRYAKEPEQRAQAVAELAKQLAPLSEEFGARTWFCGESYTLVDVAYCTFYARRDVYVEAGVKVPDNLARWFERIGARPAYQATGGLVAR